MLLNAEAYARQLKQLLPTGAAWNLDIGSRLSALLRGLAEELARVDARGDALVDESDPRTTVEMMTDWERVLGLPNPCVTTALSVAQRRAAIVERVTSLGGQTPVYFIAVALALGYTITITEFRPYNVGDPVNVPIYDDAWAYAWQVNAPLNTVILGDVLSGVDDPLASWSNESLECVLTRWKPAHTHILFAYT